MSNNTELFEFVRKTVDAMCTERKLAWKWQNDEDLYQHLFVTALQAAQEHNAEHALLSTFVCNRLRYAALDFVRTERNRGLVMGHRAQDIPQFLDVPAVPDRAAEDEGCFLDSLDDLFEIDEAIELDRDAVRTALERIKPEDADILRRFCGSDGYEEHTLAMLAVALNLQYPEMARRRVSQAIAALKSELE